MLETVFYQDKKMIKQERRRQARGEAGSSNNDRRWRAYRERIATEASLKAVEEERIQLREFKAEERKRHHLIESQKHRLRTAYKMSIEDYNELLAQQSEKCAICGKHQSEFNYPLHVDHDHTTGRVRGLLCCGCNTGLGHFEKLHKEMQTYLDGCSDCNEYND